MAEARKVDPEVVNAILFGAGEKRRYTQDTPILPDVWQKLAAAPSQMHDLLITPLNSLSALEVLMELSERLPPETLVEARAAPLQSFVAIRLSFTDIVSFVLPMTLWAHATAKNFEERLTDGWQLSGTDAFRQVHASALGRMAGRAERAGSRKADAGAPGDTALRGPMLDAARVLTLIAAIGVAQDLDRDFDSLAQLEECGEQIADRLDDIALSLAFSSSKASIWRVALNRPLELSTSYSRATIKADAAYRVFDVKCESVTWAVIDSGIQWNHPAFMWTPPGKNGAESRVVGTYNMGILRELLDVRYRRNPSGNPMLARCIEASGLKAEEATNHLEAAYQSYTTKMLDWSSIEPLLRMNAPPAPTDGHGTHVAGIIGADWWETKDEARSGSAAEAVRTLVLRGMCPDIKLMDFRILGAGEDETEFAVIGALQLVRYLNSHNRYIVVHGVNLSLSIPHEVENYACGSTPVCDECERLVGAGVTVVAAAGNQGYQKFRTEKGLFAGYSAFSITDPGNAESVITVGATHRREPHTYGVSYFSSRGPTGDGRAKPDIVAPGERILSTLPGAGNQGESGYMDGTSQAAPHVSAAAAMLMARYPELNRNPRRIKQLLCENATDLGRERAFQGNGLLDVLRALQGF